MNDLLVVVMIMGCLVHDGEKTIYNTHNSRLKMEDWFSSIP